MLAFVCAKRMAWADGDGQTCEAGCAAAAMLALIFWLLAALIQDMLALVIASRVARTG